MVMIKGILANLVNKPRISKMEQKNSENTARNKETEAFIPKISGKLMVSPNNFSNLGYPWLSIMTPAPIRNKSETTLKDVSL